MEWLGALFVILAGLCHAASALDPLLTDSNRNRSKDLPKSLIDIVWNLGEPYWEWLKSLFWYTVAYVIILTIVRHWFPEFDITIVGKIIGAIFSLLWLLTLGVGLGLIPALTLSAAVTMAVAKFLNDVAIKRWIKIVEIILGISGALLIFIAKYA